MREKGCYIRICNVYCTSKYRNLHKEVGVILLREKC